VLWAAASQERPGDHGEEAAACEAQHLEMIPASFKGPIDQPETSPKH
jgi:hypothetical protein